MKIKAIRNQEEPYCKRSSIIALLVIRAVMETPRMPWRLRFCPVRKRLGSGVRGVSTVVSGLRQSLRIPYAEPKGGRV